MDAAVPHDPDENPSLPDKLGYNIPPNERFIRDQQDWQPQFDPLGQPTAPDPAQAAPPDPAPAAPGQSLPAYIPPQPAPPTYHRHRSRHLHRHGGSHWPSWGWLIPVGLMVAFGGGFWWLFFLCWPLMGIIKRSAHSGDWKPVGGLLVVGGGLALLTAAGVGMTVLLPLLLIAAGGYFLLRSLRVSAHI